MSVHKTTTLIMLVNLPSAALDMVHVAGEGEEEEEEREEEEEKTDTSTKHK